MRVRGGMWIRIAAATLLAALAFIATQARAQDHSRYALIIANEAYAPSVGPLKNPHKDAEVIRAALIAVGFPEANIEIVRDASRGQMLAAVARYRLAELRGKKDVAAGGSPGRPASQGAKCDGVEVGLGSGGTTYVKPGSGKSFRDCAECPEMVVLPKGSYKRGSEDGASDEKPVRTVMIDYNLAVGKFEVTFTEWDACVAAGGCTHKPGDEGWGRGNRPVINVSWEDARAYVKWLSAKTGKTYRLLTEAEWEYAARGVTRASAPHKKYPWSDTASHEYANYGKDECCDGLAEGRDEWVHTAPVGKFPANAFGLHDMHGNVWEWVQDCYANSYEMAPVDGSVAPETSNCSRVHRGGSWYVNPQFLRSAYRFGLRLDFRNRVSGFRLARTITP